MALKTLGISVFVVFLGVCSAQKYPDWPAPPNHEDNALYARYIVHNANWGVLSAISPEFNQMPFGAVQSIADGPVSMSSGVPYFYITNIADTFINMRHNNSACLTLSMATGNQCKDLHYDAEDPRCGRVNLMGELVEVKDKSELAFAQSGFFERHPSFKHTGPHAWQFYKLDLQIIHLLDFYGGAKIVDHESYFKAKP